MRRINNYSYQHLWVRAVTSFRWLSGESSGIVIGRYIKDSGLNSGRNVRHTVTRRSMSVHWVAYTTCYSKTEGTELGGIELQIPGKSGVVKTI